MRRRSEKSQTEDDRTKWMLIILSLCNRHLSFFRKKKKKNWQIHDSKVMRDAKLLILLGNYLLKIKQLK